MKLSLGDYSQRGVKKQTSKQQQQKNTQTLAGVHKEQVLRFLTSEGRYLAKIISSGRFHIIRLYLHLLFKKKINKKSQHNNKETSQDSEKRELDLNHQFMRRLPLAKPVCAWPGPCPLSRPALLFRPSRGSVGAQLCCFGLIPNSKAEPGKPALPLRGLHMAGVESWAVSVSGSKQERQSKKRKKKKPKQLQQKKPANRA